MTMKSTSAWEHAQTQAEALRLLAKPGDYSDAQPIPASTEADPKPYTTKAGATQWKPSFRWIEQAAESYEGFCLACASVESECEPDARRLTCSHCGANKVYGAEELALMGLCH